MCVCTHTNYPEVVKSTYADVMHGTVQTDSVGVYCFVSMKESRFGVPIHREALIHNVEVHDRNTVGE